MPHDITGINSNKSSQMGDRAVSNVKNSDDSKKTSNTDNTSSASSSASSSDKVTLTDTAAKLKALESELTNQPMVNDSKVKDMQTSIQSGNYKMDPESIADKMINFESAFNDS